MRESFSAARGKRVLTMVEISILNTGEYEKLSELAADVKLDEKIDFKCMFLAARDENKRILGVAGFNINYVLPKFEHIIVRSGYQKRGLAFRLMRECEKLLAKSGFKEYAALIPYSNETMQKYAFKFGFKKYDENKKGIWVFKRLEGD